LEENALQLMEEVEQIPKSIEAVLACERAYIEEREKIRTASTLEKAQQEQEIVDATSRWQALAPQVMAPVLQRYKQIRERSGGLAVSRVIAGACGDCHVTVVASLLRSIVEGNELVPCQNCNRLLYTEGE
jgi:predicted  nucleic acid-binding Zn-ribbon protein